MGFMIRGFIWDIPILTFAYVLFLGPYGSVYGPFWAPAQQTLQYHKEARKGGGSRSKALKDDMNPTRVYGSYGGIPENGGP